LSLGGNGNAPCRSARPHHPAYRFGPGAEDRLLAGDDAAAAVQFLLVVRHEKAEEFSRVHVEILADVVSG
jgi:hypothetical protein